MKKNYLISSKAISDLEKIWLYTLKKWSKEQADRYHNLIVDEIEYIAENYEICRRIDHIRPGYRISKVKSHLIFHNCPVKTISLNSGFDLVQSNSLNH
jgi:toxin ParE1/3/4